MLMNSIRYYVKRTPDGPQEQLLNGSWCQNGTGLGDVFHVHLSARGHRLTLSNYMSPEGFTLSRENMNDCRDGGFFVPYYHPITEEEIAHRVTQAKQEADWFVSALSR